MAEIKKINGIDLKDEKARNLIADLQDRMEAIEEGDINLEDYPTKEDLNSYATKEDLNNYATKDNLNDYATKSDLENHPTKEDLNDYATKEDLNDLDTYVSQDTFNQELENINTNQTQINNRLDGMGTSLNEVNTQMRALEETVDTQITTIETTVNNSISNQETRINTIETDLARKEVLIQALLNEETDKVVTVEASGNEKHLDYSVDDWMVKLNKIEGQTLVNVCDQKDPIAITKSYTVEGTNHVPLQGEYDGKARPVVYGNTLVNRAYGEREINVLPKMELQGNNNHNIEGVDGAKVEVSNIKGKTLVNLVGKGYNTRITLDYNNVTYQDIHLCEVSRLKLDTPYTFVVYVTPLEGHSTSYNLYQLGFGTEQYGAMRGHGTMELYGEDGTLIEGNSTKYHDSYRLVFKVIFRDFGEYGQYLKARPLRLDLSMNPDASIRCHATVTTMIFEGDLTQTPELIPTEYVEGLKSSFEDSYLDNLLDTSLIEIGNINSNTGLDLTASSIARTPFMFYEKGANVRIYINTPEIVMHKILLYDENNNIVFNDIDIDGSSEYTISSPENASRIRVCFRLSSDANISDINVFKQADIYVSTKAVQGEDFNHLGQYKAEVKTVGKNKFEGSLPEQLDYTIRPCYLKKGTYNFSADVGGFDNGNRFTIAFNDIDGNTITNTKIGNSTTLSRDCYELHFYSNGHNYSDSIGNYINITNLQIEEGTVATDYEPYKEATHVVYLNTPLLEGDELVYKDGQLYHYHKMGKVVLDGSEGWGINIEHNNVIGFKTTTKYDFARAYRDCNICDKFLFAIDGNDHPMNVDYECIAGQGSGPYNLAININKSKLSTVDANGFIQWLQANPTTVLYQLITPWYEPIGAYGKVVLDGSNDEDWFVFNQSSEIISYAGIKIPSMKEGYTTKIICDKFETLSDGSDYDQTYTKEQCYSYHITPTSNTGVIYFHVFNSKLSSYTKEGWIQWLQQNPVTVIYELANPNTTKEPIAIDVFNNSTLTINSNVPVESTVTNYSYRLTGFSEPYTLNYKADGEVTHEIVDDRLTFYGNGEKVNDVILVDGENTPTGDYFEGMQSAFEDGHIPEGVILNDVAVSFPGLVLNEDIYKTDSNSHMDNMGIKIYNSEINKFTIGKTYLFILDVTNYSNQNVEFKSGFDSNGKKEWESVGVIPANKTSRIIVKKQYNGLADSSYNVLNFGSTMAGVSYGINKNIKILEGDWTHLSEEDFNHLGQYKVEYKVTGKNKFDLNKPFNMVYGEYGAIVGIPVISENGIIPNGKVGSYSSMSQDYSDIIKQNTTYTISFYSESVSHICRIYDNSTYTDIISPIGVEANTRGQVSFNIENRNPADIRILFHASVDNNIHRILDIQLEEGSTPTEYEPYKEQIKTFYLNSPLLEGDTIEDVNGVATHVHRRWKYTFNGSEGWKRHVEDWNGVQQYVWFDGLIFNSPGTTTNPIFAADCLIGLSRDDTYLVKNVDTVEELKQWLHDNPITIVYELASPIYEPIGAYGKIVLDGSEDEGWETHDSEQDNVSVFKGLINNVVTLSANEFYCNKLPTLNKGDCWKGSVGVEISLGVLYIALPSTTVSEHDLDGFKQWLQQNPITVIYELAEPQYQESILCDSYVNGHLDFDTNVPVEKVKFGYWYKPLVYINPNTTYIIQFESDNVGKLDVLALASVNKLNNLDVVKGINKFNITTDSLAGSSTGRMYLDLHGIGFNASNIQVVQADENIEFDYFEGLQSSFEDIPIEILDRSSIVENYCLSWDSGEPYGIQNYYHTDYIPVQLGEKYRTSCPASVFLYDEDKQFICYSDKLTGWKTGGQGGVRVTEWVIPLDIPNVQYMRLESQLNLSAIEDFKLFDYKQYQVEYKVTGKNKCYKHEVLNNNKNLSIYHKELKLGQYRISMETPTLFDRNTVYAKGNTILGYISSDGQGNARATINITEENINAVNSDDGYIWIYRSNGDISDITNIQLEEGTVTTEYEPYKEYTKTFYLNSPLLEGDTIEEVNGKICHYHKMGMVVLDGSEDWALSSATFVNCLRCDLNGFVIPNNVDNSELNLVCDRLLAVPRSSMSSGNDITIDGDFEHITHSVLRGSDYYLSINILKSKLSTPDLAGFKQWLQANPTTVVYELAEPYAEPIEPEQEQLLISSVKEGDLSTETAVPIKNMSISYTTSIPNLKRLEDTIQAVQNAQVSQVNYDDIIDDIVNE